MRLVLTSRCIHHFNSDSIYDMDDMSISGTEHSSVILSQTKQLKKFKAMFHMYENKLKTERDGVINNQSYNSNEF